MIALGVVVGCLLVTVVLKVWQDRSGGAANADMMFETFAGALGYGAMGYLITTRAAGNRLGPLMLGLGVVAGLQGLLGSIDSARSELRIPEPMGAWLYGLTSACQMLFVGGVIVLLLLAPTGRPLTSRWRWVIWVTAVSVCSATLDALIFRKDQDAGIEPTGAAAVVNGLLSGLGGFLTLGLVAAPLCLVLRWYRAKGLERQQVMWVAAGGLAGPLLIVVAGQLPEWALRTINGLDAVLHGSLVQFLLDPLRHIHQ